MRAHDKLKINMSFMYIDPSDSIYIIMWLNAINFNLVNKKEMLVFLGIGIQDGAGA